MSICQPCHRNVIEVPKVSEVINAVNLSMQMALDHYSRTCNVSKDQILGNPLAKIALIFRTQ